MENKIIINAQQIVTICVVPAIPVNDLTKIWEGIGHWEYKEYKTVKRLFRKPIEVYAPGWYRTSTFSYTCDKKYIETDEELMVYLKKKYITRYQIKDKVLYRCIRARLFYSNDHKDDFYFNDEMECKDFLDKLCSSQVSVEKNDKTFYEIGRFTELSPKSNSINTHVERFNKI